MEVGREEDEGLQTTCALSCVLRANFMDACRYKFGPSDNEAKARETHTLTTNKTLLPLPDYSSAPIGVLAGTEPSSSSPRKHTVLGTFEPLVLAVPFDVFPHYLGTASCQTLQGITFLQVAELSPFLFIFPSSLLLSHFFPSNPPLPLPLTYKSMFTLEVYLRRGKTQAKPHFYLSFSHESMGRRSQEKLGLAITAVLCFFLLERQGQVSREGQTMKLQVLTSVPLKGTLTVGDRDMHVSPNGLKSPASPRLAFETKEPKVELCSLYWGDFMPS